MARKVEEVIQGSCTRSLSGIYFDENGEKIVKKTVNLSKVNPNFDDKKVIEIGTALFDLQQHNITDYYKTDKFFIGATFEPSKPAEV